MKLTKEEREGIVVSGMHFADHGELEARITVDGESRDVTRRSGSWMVMDGESVRDLRSFYYAAALAEHARDRGFVDRRYQLVRPSVDG